MSRKFWNWIKNENDRTLYLDGYIAENSWFDDDITPKQWLMLHFQEQNIYWF
jgi:ATP-dependent Clp protease protease subunit